LDKITLVNLEDLRSDDKELRYQAFTKIIKITDAPVDWAYQIWDEMIANLKHKDNHVRAIAAQLLCNLAKSDPEKRMLKDFGSILAVTRDERFVTARHSLQAIWKVGLAGEKQLKLLLEGLETRYHECITEKNCTLIRYDIIQNLRKLYEEAKVETIREKALTLIELEDDLKYRKKYACLWRKR
jgi:HEAT repeat protein